MIQKFSFNIPRWRVTEMNGYEPITTFWMDFWIAVPYGASAVQDTYNRAFAEWQSSPEYMTELSLVLNHIGDVLYHRPETKELGKLFYELYEKHNDWCWANFNEEQKEYYFSITD